MISFTWLGSIDDARATGVLLDAVGWGVAMVGIHLIYLTSRLEAHIVSGEQKSTYKMNRTDI